MSIKISLSSDGLEELYTPATLKEMCLYKCLTNKDILTKEMEVDEATNGSEKLDWEKFRLKEPIQKDLVEALLDAGDAYLFMLTPKYEAILAAIRMSQPEHLVKVHVNNTPNLQDHQLELLLSGGNVKSLDIHGCNSLREASLDVINKFGSKLEYLRIGDSSQILPQPDKFCRQMQKSAILRTLNLKTFIVCEIYPYEATEMTNYWRFLLQKFISNLEDLQISRINKFETLGFLEPAKSKLSSLTLTHCLVANNANAWASLFKLHKLRSLDLAGSSIEEAFVGENVVQRLLTVMPNLAHLAVDPGLIKDVNVDPSIRGQGPVAKRLEFLGVMENDEVELGKAKLLANDVACFGTVEGELRILEYFSNRRNSGYFHPTLERLLINFSLVTSPWRTVAVIRLLIETIKNNGNHVVVHPYCIRQILKKLLTTTGVAVKLGKVLVDQCFEATFPFKDRWRQCNSLPARQITLDSIDIMMILDGELCLDHYVTIVPMVMRSAEIVLRQLDSGDINTDINKCFLEKTAQVLEKALDQFPGETNQLWGISSVLGVMDALNDVMVRWRCDIFGLVTIFSRIITTLRKLCLNSGPRRKAFYSVGGVEIVIDSLKEITDGCLSVAYRDCLALLEILKSILQDTDLDLSKSEFRKIATGIGKLLISVRSKWELRKTSNSDSDTTYYFQLEMFSSFLNSLQSDPRYDYKTNTIGVKKIMMKFK